MYRYSHEGGGDYSYTGRGRGRPYTVSVQFLMYISAIIL